MLLLREPNAEPIPGYRLLEPLGTGGFGEVWKCEAPGGLIKAIKFVAGRGDSLHGDGTAEQELRALQYVRTLRHPYLLSIDRAEIIEGELVLVMELADCNLGDLLREQRAIGEPGISRAEAIAYLREAAEALDMMNLEYGLQHLDIKPRNLFRMGRHIKVADFGLVNSLAELHGRGAKDSLPAAITPLYAAPEVFLGKVSIFSDQYSLAITYHELVTGALPFTGKVFNQLAMAHLQHEPNLNGLSASDRQIVKRALAKNPRDRFSSCSDFIRALEATSVSTNSGQCRETVTPSRPPSGPDLHFIQLGELAATTTFTPAALQIACAGKAAAPSAMLDKAVSTAGDPLAAYDLQECTIRTPLGEVWKAMGPDGRRRLIRLIFGASASDDPQEDVISRLGELKHPILPPCEIFRTGGDRLAFVTDLGDETLGSRLKECMQQGLAGIPRRELLAYLRPVAEGLDQLYQTYRLQHLGLTPRLLFLDRGSILMSDFGLVELVWLPAGRQPEDLNARYAAPELFEGRISRTSDQYALALIYQELLTGLHPFRNLAGRQAAAARLRGRPDVSMLPAADRTAVLKALDLQPENRHRTCTEFITELEAIAPDTVSVSLHNTAPMTVSLGQRLSGRHRIVAAAVGKKAVENIIEQAEKTLGVCQGRGFRYRQRPGELLEHHCHVRIVPGMFRLKLEAFRQLWKAEQVASEGQSYTMRIGKKASLWRRALGGLPALDVQVQCEAVGQDRARLTVRVRPTSLDVEGVSAMLAETGPELISSLRTFLAAEPDRREEERVPFERPVQVCPIEEQGTLGEAVTAEGRDLCRLGIGLILLFRPANARVCVLLPRTQGTGTVPVMAEVLHAAPVGEGRFEAGLRFVFD